MRRAGALTAAVVAIAILRSLDPSQAEAYVRVTYPPLTGLASAAVASAPWSWTAVALVLGAAATAFVLARRGVAAAARVLAFAALAALAWGTVVWGVHYERAPWDERGGMPADGAPADVDGLATHLVAVVRAAANAIPADGRDPDRAIAAIATELERTARAEDALAVRVPERVKLVPAGILLGLGSGGVISPWLLEAHVDAGLPAAARIAVAAHELAHLAGYAREDDAEVAGALAGLRADDPYARYSVALFQLAAAASALTDADRDALLAALPAHARDDLDAARTAARRYVRPQLAAMQRWIYDRYLRAQGVTEGVASYAGSTELLARAWLAGRLPEP